MCWAETSVEPSKMVGPEVLTFRKGDEIFAMPGIDRGSEAEFAIVKENEAAKKPQRLDHTSAAAIPLAG